MELPKASSLLKKDIHVLIIWISGLLKNSESHNIELQRINGSSMKQKPFRVNISGADLPHYLSPKIISAVGYIHQASPSIPNAIKRIDKMKNYLSEQELKWVMALLVFDRLVDMAQSSNEFKDFKNTVDERKKTIN